MLKIGLALEGLLVDVEKHFDIWKSRQGGASSYMDTKVINDESFWASLKPHRDVEVFKSSEDLYILTERPQKLFLVTRSWLRREGLRIPDSNIIMQSSGPLKRYDCRLHDLDYFVDSDPEVINGFVHDRCIPIGVTRGRGGFAPWVRTYGGINFVRFESDLRDWKLI